MKRSLGKIKRHKKIYRKSSFRIDPLRTVVFSVSAVLLFGLGWVLYGLAYDLFTGELTLPLPEREQQTPEENLPQESEPPALEETQEPAQEQSLLQGAYLPPFVVMDEAALSAALDSLKAKGLNSVLVDLKNEQGELLYQSANETATAVGAVASSVSASRIVALIREKDMEPIARLHAFKDPLVSINRLGMAVHYQDSDWAWLDDSQQNGGKAWLNPYSPDAQQYITDLCLEVSSAGFDHIVLASVQFPQGYSLDLTGYGNEAQGKSKSAVLKEFTDGLRAQLEEQGTSLYIYADGAALLGDNAAFLGEDIWAPLENGAAISAMPASFGIAFDVMETGSPVPLEVPVTHPGKTVSTVAASMKTHLAPEADSLVFLQAYTALEFSGVNFLEYTQTQIDQQTEALKQAGFYSYILYNPSGTYP